MKTKHLKKLKEILEDLKGHCCSPDPDEPDLECGGWEVTPIAMLTCASCWCVYDLNNLVKDIETEL